MPAVNTEQVSLVMEALYKLLPILAGLLFLGLVGWKLISHLIDVWLKKLNRAVENTAGYISSAQHTSCRAAQDGDRQEIVTSINSLKNEMKDAMNSLKTETRERQGEMRGILLAVALKAGVPAEDLKILTK